jgi:hypothetical protein
MHHFQSWRYDLIRVAVAILLVAAGAVHANAQTPQASSPVGMGLKSGVQWPTADGGADQLGSNIGLFVDYNGKGSVGVIGDVLFVMTPQSNVAGVPSGRLHYFHLPAMLRVRGGGESFGAYGVVGPAFNFKVAGNDGFQDHTVDVVFGGGVEIKNAMVEARISRGSRDRVLSGVTSSYTQQTFALLVAFRLAP